MGPGRSRRAWLTSEQAQHLDASVRWISLQVAAAHVLAAVRPQPPVPISECERWLRDSRSRVVTAAASPASAIRSSSRTSVGTLGTLRQPRDAASTAGHVAAGAIEGGTRGTRGTRLAMRQKRLPARAKATPVARPHARWMTSWLSAAEDASRASLASRRVARSTRQPLGPLPIRLTPLGTLTSRWPPNYADRASESSRFRATPDPDCPARGFQ